MVLARYLHFGYLHGSSGRRKTQPSFVAMGDYITFGRVMLVYTFCLRLASRLRKRLPAATSHCARLKRPNQARHDVVTVIEQESKMMLRLTGIGNMIQQLAWPRLLLRLLRVVKNIGGQSEHGVSVQLAP